MVMSKSHAFGKGFEAGKWCGYGEHRAPSWEFVDASDLGEDLYEGRFVQPIRKKYPRLCFDCWLTSATKAYRRTFHRRLYNILSAVRR